MEIGAVGDILLVTLGIIEIRWPRRRVATHIHSSYMLRWSYSSLHNNLLDTPTLGRMDEEEEEEKGEEKKEKEEQKKYGGAEGAEK